MGSLVAALASYLDAKRQNGLWLVRMENLDPPREQPGADQLILQALKAHQLHWDQDVVFQSQRHHAYLAASQQLEKYHHAFRCSCSRSQLAPYNNLHLKPCPAPATDHYALRVSVHRQVALPECFTDRWQGLIKQNLATEVGDFVILRKDKLYAYQLAVVVDDIAQGVTHIVRGDDLMDSTLRQIYLTQLLRGAHDADLGMTDKITPIEKPSNQTPPKTTASKAIFYAHIPVVRGANGQKLSKQNHAPALDNNTPHANLITAMRYLNLPVTDQLNDYDIHTLLQWGTEHWPLTR